MPKDPVCQMDVEPDKAAGKSVYKGADIYFCSLHCKELFDANPESFIQPSLSGIIPPHPALSGEPAGEPTRKGWVGVGRVGPWRGQGEGESLPSKAISHEMAKDPVCGMVVVKGKSLKTDLSGRTYYFCSIGCLRTFEAPEAELKSLKKRVSIALAGVLVIAVLRAGFFLGLATGATIITWAPIPALPWFTWGVWLFILVTPVQFIGGWGFYKGAYNAVKNRAINMDFLIAMGTTTAYLYSVIVIFIPDILPVKIEERDVYFEVSAVIIAFVLFGKYMEEIIKKKSSVAVRKLIDLKPLKARVLRDSQEMEIPAEGVQAGDVVIVKPGEKIPTDGIVTDGLSAVDEKMITGESIPADKKPGSLVIGATINKSGLLRFRATAVGADTTLNQIIKMVEEAQASSAPIQRIADTVTGYFVPAVVGSAAFAFFGWWFVMGNFPQGLMSFIAVLIIACPCALGIATPAALMVGVGRGAEGGILIRGGEYLERAQKLSTVIFDKTGTLTVGEPVLKDIIALRGNEIETLFYAAVAEKGSEHPIARAILNAAAMRNIQVPSPESFEAIPGHGVRAGHKGETILLGNRKLMEDNGVPADAIEDTVRGLENEGRTVMIVARGSGIIGVLSVADPIKPHAGEAVDALKKQGVKVIMLTGDNKRTAIAVAKEVNIDNVISEVLPQDKARIVTELKHDSGEVVAMVGDGINDAPALAEADIGIAIGSGSDIAKETGGIILVKDDLRDVVKGIRLSQKTMRKIKQNLFWAFFYNGVGIPVAAFGLLNPIIAAAAMALSSLSVVANSASLKMADIDGGN